MDLLPYWKTYPTKNIVPLVNSLQQQYSSYKLWGPMDAKRRTSDVLSMIIFCEAFLTVSIQSDIIIFGLSFFLSYAVRLLYRTVFRYFLWQVSFPSYLVFRWVLPIYEDDINVSLTAFFYFYLFSIYYKMSWWQCSSKSMLLMVVDVWKRCSKQSFASMYIEILEFSLRLSNSWESYFMIRSRIQNITYTVVSY